MKLAYRPTEVAAVLGSPQVFALMVKKGWLKPILSGARLTLYDGGAIAAAYARFKSDPAALMKRARPARRKAVVL